MAGRLWTEKASFSFDPNGQTFVVTFTWGRIISIDLATGRITRSGDAVGVEKGDVSRLEWHSWPRRRSHG